MLTQRDRDTFFALVDGRPLPEEPSPAIIDALEHFRTALRRPGITPELIWRGVERLIIVDIDLSRERDDPQLIFESLNSTGVDLTQADLIRNFLLMDLLPDVQRRVYQDSWYPMERALGHGENTTLFDRFVRDYLTLKTGQIVRLDRVYASYKAFLARPAGAATPPRRPRTSAASLATTQH